MNVTELWVERANLRRTRIVEQALPPLAEGQVLLAIDKFALTANNVSYAVSGDMIGYWKYFPAEGEWGKVPVWGFADVVESRAPEIAVGERIWGFLPMATHLVVTPGAVTPQHFFDFAAHRKPLPGLYNQYQRTAADPPAFKAMEDARCLLFPLFATSFILYDYLLANRFFGAEQVLIGSASSKTGFGLAYLLHAAKGEEKRRAVGLTSTANKAFVEKLGFCDEVAGYDEIARLDPARPTAFVDMAGSATVLRAVHEHFGERLVESCLVGATHWEAERKRGPLPGAKPQFFFAPAHIARREQEWGRGSFMPKAFAASARITAAAHDAVKVEQHRGAAEVERMFHELIDNRVAPSRGLMLSLATSSPRWRGEGA